MKDISEKERFDYKEKVIKRIIFTLTDERNSITDLGDIGNMIGMAVGSVTCKDGVDQNIWSFEKDDFDLGFEHGYSLMNGQH